MLGLGALAPSYIPHAEQNRTEDRGLKETAKVIDLYLGSKGLKKFHNYIMTLMGSKTSADPADQRGTKSESTEPEF